MNLVLVKGVRWTVLETEALCSSKEDGGREGRVPGKASLANTLLPPVGPCQERPSLALRQEFTFHGTLQPWQILLCLSSARSCTTNVDVCFAIDFNKSRSWSFIFPDFKNSTPTEEEMQI